MSIYYPFPFFNVNGSTHFCITFSHLIALGAHSVHIITYVELPIVKITISLYICAIVDSTNLLLVKFGFLFFFLLLRTIS